MGVIERNKIREGCYSTCSSDSACVRTWWPPACGVARVWKMAPLKAKGPKKKKTKHKYCKITENEQQKTNLKLGPYASQNKNNKDNSVRRDLTRRQNRRSAALLVLEVVDDVWGGVVFDLRGVGEMYSLCARERGKGGEMDSEGRSRSLARSKKSTRSLARKIRLHQ